MPRTVVVRDYSQTPPYEVGRVTLGEDGEAVLEGFDTYGYEDFREAWETTGLPTFYGDMQPVPLSDGARFLHALLQEFRGSHVRASEEH